MTSFQSNYSENSRHNRRQQIRKIAWQHIMELRNKTSQKTKKTTAALQH